MLTTPHSALFLPTVQATLDRLYKLSDSKDDGILQAVAASGYDWKSANTEQN